MDSTPCSSQGYNVPIWLKLSMKYRRAFVLATFKFALTDLAGTVFLHHTYSRSKSNSDFFCSVGESGDGGLSLSIIVGPAASNSRCGLERNWRRIENTINYVQMATSGTKLFSQCRVVAVRATVLWLINVTQTTF